MRTALVMLLGLAVGGIVGAFAVGTARGGDSSGESIRVTILNVGTAPVTASWPNKADWAMAERCTLQPNCFIHFPRPRSDDDIDIRVEALNGGDPRPVDAKELAGVKSHLVGWEKNAVVQRRANSCIATGFEYLLRSAGVQGIDYEKFQDDFDLGVELNAYPTVARAIERKYPDVRIAWSDFKSSEESMQFIERSIDEGRPIVLGLPGSPTSTHIVPVLGYDQKWVYYLNYAHADGTKDVRAIRRWELARRDQEWVTGTCATAWLVTWWPPAADTKDAAKPDATKSERRADPAAEGLFKAYAELVHYPATEGWKSVTAKGEWKRPQGTLGINPKWTPDTGFDVDVTVPESVKDPWLRSLNAEQLSAVHLGLLRMDGANTPFELPGGWAKDREHFHVALRQAGDDQVVEMTAFDDKAGVVKSRRYVFGKEGLLKSSSIECGPMGGWPDGKTTDADWCFEKKGERYVIASIKFSDRARGEERGAKFDYYDGPNGGALLKAITFTSPSPGAGEEDMRFHDYVVDGKLVETTTAATDGNGK